MRAIFTTSLRAFPSNFETRYRLTKGERAIRAFVSLTSWSSFILIPSGIFLFPLPFFSLRSFFSQKSTRLDFRPNPVSSDGRDRGRENGARNLCPSFSSSSPSLLPPNHQYPLSYLLTYIHTLTMVVQTQRLVLYSAQGYVPFPSGSELSELPFLSSIPYSSPSIPRF